MKNSARSGIASSIPAPILPDLLFERLATKCRLALLSNTDPIHVAHIEANYPFVRHFPVRVYSCRVGSSKPSPVIYHHALREVGAMPDEAMFIDDMRENVVGRRQPRHQRLPLHFRR